MNFKHLLTSTHLLVLIGKDSLGRWDSWRWLGGEKSQFCSLCFQTWFQSNQSINKAKRQLLNSMVYALGSVLSPRRDVKQNTPSSGPGPLLRPCWCLQIDLGSDLALAVLLSTGHCLAHLSPMVLSSTRNRVALVCYSQITILYFLISWILWLE